MKIKPHLQSRSGFCESHLSAFVPQNIIHDKTLDKPCLWFRTRGGQIALFTPSFLWFCAAWNASPTGVVRGINTSPSQVSTGVSAQLPLCTHFTPLWGMWHQLRAFCSHRGIFLPLSPARWLHTALYCTAVLVRDQSFQAKWYVLLYFPWQKYHVAFPVLLLSSSDPHWLLFLLWIYPISVPIRPIECKVIPPSMCFTLFRKEAMKCWDFETFYLFSNPWVKTSPHV